MAQKAAELKRITSLRFHGTHIFLLPCSPLEAWDLSGKGCRAVSMARQSESAPPPGPSQGLLAPRHARALPNSCCVSFPHTMAVHRKRKTTLPLAY